MSERERIGFICRDEAFIRKMDFALSLIGLECFVVRDAAELRSLAERKADAVFFDSSADSLPVFEAALELRHAWSRAHWTPFLLYSCDCGITEKHGEYAVFDDFCMLPFQRKELYGKLKNFHLAGARESGILPFLSALPEDSLHDFVKDLRKKGLQSVPKYTSNGYVYPEADRFFPGDSKDSISALLKLHTLGYLSRELFDRVHQCPQCSSSQLNFRECCPQCHSIDFSAVEMLHHFSCGYVGDFNEFQSGGQEELICPKCSRTIRHIGMDYEKPLSAFKCNACTMRFSVPAVRCRCFRCEMEFEPSEALVQNFYSYTPQEPPQECRTKDEMNHNGMPYSVSMEMFQFLLRQNYYISKELGQTIYIIAINAFGMREKRILELLRAIHEFKRPSDILCLCENGILMMQVFYISSEELASRLELLTKSMEQFPEFQHRNPPYRIFRFDCSNETNIGLIVSGISDASFSGTEEIFQ